MMGELALSECAREREGPRERSREREGVRELSRVRKRQNKKKEANRLSDFIARAWSREKM